MMNGQAMRASDRNRGCASLAGNVNRRVITSTGEFLDASRTGGILPILVRPGAIHAELIHTHLGPIVADAVYCSLPLALLGETAADRVCLVVPMNRTGNGQLNGESLIPGNFLAFGGSAEVAGASGAPLQCGILSIPLTVLERTATALDIKSRPPGKGEFRVAPVVDRDRLSRAFGLLSRTVKHHKNAMLIKREATATVQAFLEIAVRSLAGDSSSSSPYQSARLTSAEIARTCEDYARKWRYQNVTLADLCEASGVSRAASPLRLLRVLPDVAHRLPACHRAQRGAARARRGTSPTRCRQPCRDGLGLLAPQSLRCPISGAIR